STRGSPARNPRQGVLCAAPRFPVSPALLRRQCSQQRQKLRDTVGQPLSAETGVPNMPSWKAKMPHSRWVGTRRVGLRYVSSSPPFSTVHATFTAHGAAPLVVLHGPP